MKLETKRKIRRWVCRRLGLPETETVPYPVNVYQGRPITLGAQGVFQKCPWRPELEKIDEDHCKRELALQLAEAILEDGRCGITVEDAEKDSALRVMTIHLMIVPWGK